jgi:hypothetical protein
MERHLGRCLDDDEEVHHRDENPLNNTIGNLEVLRKGPHARKHAKPAPMIELICVNCGKMFSRLARKERDRVKAEKAGPYCDKACVGKSHGRHKLP